MAAAIQTMCSDSDRGRISPHAAHSVVRRPMLDLKGRVHAYELVFRGGPVDDGVSSFDHLAETARKFGLEKPSELKKLTGKLTAFVHCSLEAVTEEIAQILPPTLTVLEITPNGDLSPELILRCEQLKKLGFRIALSGLTDCPVQISQLASLLELADYFEIDFCGSAEEVRRGVIEAVRGKPLIMVAKGVDSQADYRKAREEGFTLFEGCFFLEPVAMRNRRPPVNQMLRLEILKALQKHPMDMHKISDLVKRDGPITYQLLRLVNSPLWAMSQNIESIEVALVAVGENAFRRIATLAIAGEFNGDQPAELLCTAILRARICEVMAARRGLEPFGQYLLGMLSLLPAMQGQPMSEVVPTLPLSEEIREALMGKCSPERAILGWLEKFERGDWAACDAAAEADALNQTELSRTYVEAVAWTETALHSGA